MPLPPPPERYLTPDMARRIARIARSYRIRLGKPLVAAPGEDAAVVAALWHAPQVIVAHDTAADPVFFFGNRAALTAFETDVAAFTAMPSRLSAEAPDRAERDALLASVNAQGFIRDYAGVRISARGRRFRIGGAVVWNLIDSAGLLHGQAACFAPPDHARYTNLR